MATPRYATPIVAPLSMLARMRAACCSGVGGAVGMEAGGADMVSTRSRCRQPEDVKEGTNDAGMRDVGHGKGCPGDWWRERGTRDGRAVLKTRRPFK
ncbi:hypothetical protein C8Q76DRAFT_156504 [Earliella scabrosa]|nr:hypothetical protein C8Q76DRAFT_156504 [Earliella scabrosa]